MSEASTPIVNNDVSNLSLNNNNDTSLTAIPRNKSVQAHRNTSWSAAELAKVLCDRMVASGKLRTKPTFIRADRESALCRVFSDKALNCAILFNNNVKLSENDIAVRIRRVVNGQPAWLDNVVTEFISLWKENANLAKDVLFDDTSDEDNIMMMMKLI